MLTGVQDHVVEGRQLWGRSGEWVGTLACSCGWSIEVGPVLWTAQIADAWAAEWSDHVDQKGS